MATFDDFVNDPVFECEKLSSFFESWFFNERQVGAVAFYKIQELNKYELAGKWSGIRISIGGKNLKF